MSCRRSSRFWGLGCPKIFHEIEDSLDATGERELAAEYLLYSRPDDLFLYDRGYPAFWLFAFHAKEQRHYCARVRHDFHSEVKAFVADGAKERIVVLTPNAASMRQCREGHLPADPLHVRLIRVELESGEVEVLITSLRDTKAYFYFVIFPTPAGGKQPRRPVFVGVVHE